MNPCFFMHHCNIDRLYHYWVNCQGYNTYDPNTLTTTQYTSINPTDPTASPPHTAKDANGNIYDTSLDSIVPLFVGGENTFVFAPSTIFPKVRDLWTMGTSTQTGWNKLYYRYGLDGLCQSSLSSACPCQNWDWVNYNPGGNKRSDTGKEIGTPEEMALYQDLSRQFDDKVKEGKTPQEALYDLAMESCKSNPQQPLPEKELQYLKMMGVDFSASKRICDEDITEEDLEMEKNMAMSF